MTLKIGIVRETAPGERRVALDPPTAARLAAEGHQILLQSGAGTESGHPDEAWGEARIIDDPAELAQQSQVLLCVVRPEPELLEHLADGSVVIGQLSPYR